MQHMQLQIKRGANYRPIGEMVAVNKSSVFSGVMILEAGDIITNVGDSGSTNGTVGYDWQLIRSMMLNDS